MRNPSMLSVRGEVTHKYEFDAITSWLAKNKTEPVTRERLEGQPVVTRDAPLQREIRSWCEDKARSYRQRNGRAEDSGSSASAERSSVHIFIDHSNVMLGASQAGRPKAQGSSLPALRVSLKEVAL
tara:strand:+ start:1685 stop:2062 length:378 start_codon:yes stop_codon:yes gene_type:complete